MGHGTKQNGRNPQKTVLEKVVFDINASDVNTFTLKTDGMRDSSI